MQRIPSQSILTDVLEAYKELSATKAEDDS